MLTISLILLRQWQYLSHLSLSLPFICVADTAFLCKLGGEGMVTVRHVTGNDQDYLRKIPRVVVQKSALL